MDLDRSTISRNLTVLEHRGLISIEPGDDRRTQQITLTDTGEEALAAAFPLWVQAQAIVASKVDADSLDEVLEKLRTRSRAVAAD